ncbi:MAG TPA: hypothetical protein VIL37_18460 [Natronosporangium sp.]
MGTHHSGNGDNGPPDGDRPPDPELPELPAEWANIEIPDDLSELAEEAEQIRQELEQERQAARSAGHPAGTGGGEPSIGVPLLIMSVAVLITLVSLFAMTWSGSARLLPDQTSTAQPSQLPPVSLADHTGRQVALTAQAPLALLLVEGCECDRLLAATVAAAPAGVTVAAVDRSPPELPANLPATRPAPLLLGDPEGALRAELELGVPTGAAAVVLVNQAGQVTYTHLATTSVEVFRTELVALATE